MHGAPNASEYCACGNHGDHYCDTCKVRVSCSGGTATCKDKAICEICEKPYGEKDPTNHVGGKEIRKQQPVPRMVTQVIPTVRAVTQSCQVENQSQHQDIRMTIATIAVMYVKQR